MKFPKPPKSSLRQHYLLYFETALILSLATFITLFKLPFSPDPENKSWIPNEKEILYLEGMVSTIHTLDKPTPPPDIHVPIAPPADEIIEAHLQDLDIEFSVTAPLPAEENKNQIVEKPANIPLQTLPQLIGGMAKLQRNIEYPASAVRDKIEGRVIVQFIVDEKGKVYNPEIIKGLRKDIDREALRAVSKSKFLPARQKGKPIPVEQVLFILFKLDNIS